MSGGALAFVESAAQARRVLALSPRPQILALSPAAAYELELAGEKYLKAEDLYDENELASCADALIEEQAGWARFVDAWLRDRVPELKAADFRPAFMHFFHLKVMFDALRIRARVLRAVEEKIAPSRLLVFDAPPLTPKPDLFFREPLTARCLTVWAEQAGALLELLPPEGDERFEPPAHRRRAANLLDRTRLASLARRKVLPALTRPLAAARSRSSLLVWPEYEIEHLTGPLLRRGRPAASWAAWLASLPETSPLKLPPLAELASDPRFLAPLKPFSLDLSSVAASRLELWWSKIVPSCWAAYAGARRKLSERRPAGVVVPLIETPREAAALDAAKKEGVPVFLYQHGGFAGPCEYAMWDYLDLLHSDTMLFYGDEVAGRYAERLAAYPDRRARPAAVGSARLEAIERAPRDTGKLRRRLAGKDSRPLVLYFPTMHTAYRRYLCAGELPDVSHWELQRDLARLFARHPRARLLYKPFEGGYESPMERLLARELPDALVERSVPLTELVWSVDAILTDIPSTGLLEALLTDRRVLVYADARSLRMTARAKELLRARASLDETPAAFLSSVEALLREGDFSPVASPDRSFLRAYGTHVDDGRAAERAAQLIAGGAT